MVCIQTKHFRRLPNIYIICLINF